MSPRLEEALTGLCEQPQQWCPRCLKTTLIVYTITAVTRQGAQTIGGAAICHECGWSPYAGNHPAAGGGGGGRAGG